MSKYRETAAERLWKEKLDLCVSPFEGIVLIVFALAVLGVMILVEL